MMVLHGAGVGGERGEGGEGGDGGDGAHGTEGTQRAVRGAVHVKYIWNPGGERVMEVCSGAE